MSASIKRARALRRLPTDAEAKLWRHLRNRQVEGAKFVRQFPVGPYFADFACREADLIVEVDGGQHVESAYDARRSAVLAEHGFSVLRFWNNDVLQNIDGVVLTIIEHLAKAPSPGLRFAKSDLSPEGRGDQEAKPARNHAGLAPETSPVGERSAEGRVRGP